MDASAHLPRLSPKHARRLRLAAYIGGALLGLVLLAFVALWLALRASLPRIEGTLSAAPLTSPASIERDNLGVPVIRARSRLDLAFATGVAHAQDRFFQMDLMRRSAAGELAELLGASLVDADRNLRRHRFREVAAEVIASAAPQERALLDAYAAGVNFALETARARPWEYMLLRLEPEPWRSEDSILAAFSMYLSLNDASGVDEIARAHLRETLPEELFAFLHPIGTEWDSPIVGNAWRAPAIPGPEIVDLRGDAAAPRRVAHSASRARSADPLQWWRHGPEDMPGSNSWAVAGSLSESGAPLLANDMHLRLRLPNVWYRARLIVEADGTERRDLVGVTLPGLPLLIVGSNGTVAWGFTNSYGDWTDLVIVELDPADSSRYLTPDGSEPFEIRRERIEVNGAAAAEVELRFTRWGPVVHTDARGRPLALAWTAHHARATNLRLLDFETAGSTAELLDAANRAGAPVQNILAVDSRGSIGWSIMGQVPIRAGYDSTVPNSWRAAGTGWQGWREPSEYPRVIDPPSGRLWSANARTIDAETWLAFVGEGRYDLGARGAQIRAALLSNSNASAHDMAQLQIDDRALFLTRWRDLLLEVLDSVSDESAAHYEQAQGLVREWSGRAAADDAGYRIVRAFRNEVRQEVFDWLVAPARAYAGGIEFVPSPQFEGALWRLVTERPMHLLDPRHDSWMDALKSALDRTLASLERSCTDLSACVWGEENRLAMRHPLSAALPFLSGWLDMPDTPMSGDTAMPRVQSPTFGASERLVVSPGREEEGLFQMPGGQVDHPLSPFYGAGHEEWVRGEPLPLLPGNAEHVLVLKPE